MILSPNTQNIFPPLSKALGSRINSSYKKIASLKSLIPPRRAKATTVLYYFQIWNKKEHNIISSIISSHMGPMYIETPCISSNGVKHRGPSNAWALGNTEHPFIAIAPRSTMAWSGRTL